jgi:DNA ligase (NAD+)
MPKSAFDQINKDRESKHLTTFANVRNATAGSLRQLDSNITAQRKLDCFVYDLLYISNDMNFVDQKQIHQFFVKC